MRKLLITVVIFCFIICGCSSKSKGPNLVCSYTKTNTEDSTYEEPYTITYTDTDIYENDGNEITKAILRSEIVVDNQAVFDMLIEELKSKEDEYDKLSYNGITHSFEFNETSIVEKIEINFSKASISDLISIGFMNNADKDATLISVSLTKEKLESAGYSCSFDE